MKNKYQHYELVAGGHPDKYADWIADLFCNEILENDPNAKVACEVMGTGNVVFVGGEIKTTITTEKIKQIKGYVEMMAGEKQANDLVFKWCLQQQYDNITKHVEKQNGEIGAGDQGICVGYACDETEQMLPLIQVIAHRIFHLYQFAYLNPYSDWQPYKPDRKLLITMHKERIKHLIFATQQDNGDKKYVDAKLKLIFKELKKEGFKFDSTFTYKISSVWKQGGFKSDTGLTGRKLACDNFANCPTGGGAFSGKDWTKVDRTGTYYARYLAKNILAKKPKLKKVVVTLIYKIGDIYPKVYVNNEYTPQIKPLTLKEVIKKFRNVRIDWLTENHWKTGLPWERVDKLCEELKDYE